MRIVDTNFRLIVKILGIFCGGIFIGGLIIRNPFQFFVAFVFWVTCWLILHCVLGDIKPKLSAGFMGFATVTILTIVADINPIPWFAGFAMASWIMILSKWDTFSRELTGTKFQKLGIWLSWLGKLIANDLAEKR